MGYNAIDILNKCIYIENDKKAMFKDFMEDKNVSLKLKVIVKVLIKDIDRIIDYYNQLKNEIQESELEEIDFRTYDKISFLINEYNIKMHSMDLDNISANDYLKVFVELAKDKYSLFIDLQGRFYNNAKDSQSKTYEILSKMIEYTKYHVEMIEKTIA